MNTHDIADVLGGFLSLALLAFALWLALLPLSIYLALSRIEKKLRELTAIVDAYTMRDRPTPPRPPARP